jgi:hypothetical protein
LSNVALAFDFRERLEQDARDDIVLPRLLATLCAHPNKPRIFNITFCHSPPRPVSTASLALLSAQQLCSQAPLSELLAISCGGLPPEDTQAVLEQFAHRCSVLRLGWQLEHLGAVMLPVCTTLRVQPEFDVPLTALETFCRNTPLLRELQVQRIVNWSTGGTGGTGGPMLGTPLPELREIHWSEPTLTTASQDESFTAWVIARRHWDLELRNLSNISWNVPIDIQGVTKAHRFFEMLQAARMQNLLTVKADFAIHTPLNEQERKWMFEDLTRQIALTSDGVEVSSCFLHVSRSATADLHHNVCRFRYRVIFRSIEDVPPNCLRLCSRKNCSTL